MPRKQPELGADYLADCGNHPRNRPRGAPSVALLPVSGWAFLICLVPTGILAEIGAYQNDFGVYFYNTQWLFVGILPVFMVTLILIGQGKLFGVRLLNLESRLLIAAYIPTALVVIAFSLGIMPGHHFGTEYRVCLGTAFVCVITCAVCIVLILHGLRYVRWLDPKSLPHEWEISQRSDPASKLFCNQPLDPCQEAQHKWNAKHGTVAPNVHYGSFPHMKPSATPPSFLLACIAPPLAQYRMGQLWMAALATVLCAGALFFLPLEPWQSIPFWVLAAAPTATSVSIARLGQTPPNPS